VDRIRLALSKTKNDDVKPAKQIVNRLIQEIGLSPIRKEVYVVDLLKDLQGQITEAFSREDWYKKWGKHFLPSLMRAHLLQHCNNFKDPGVQHYAGKFFSQIRDQMDDLFCTLPPPKPSFKINAPDLQKNTYSHVAPPVSMHQYHNPSSGCIGGGCSVSMANGTIKKVEEIKKDDLVSSTDGKSSKVLCVVKSYCHNGKAQLVELEGGLLITAWHPVRIENRWYFPCHLGKLVEKSCQVVYNFVLENEHVVIVNGVECVTLGHGFEGDVIEHPYFGTKRVIEDLQNLSGWDSGVVELRSTSFVRNKTTGLVFSLRED